MTKHQAGFTLIELLVVVTIIGILTSIVVTALSRARLSANDAAVKADMTSVHQRAEVYFLVNKTYGSQSFKIGATNCTLGVFSDSSLANAFKAADVANSSGNVLCEAGDTYFYAAAALSNSWWCVDWQGTAKLETTAFPSSSATFTSNNNRCP